MAVKAESPVISMMQEGAGPSVRVRWVAAGIKPRVPHFRSAADTPLPPPDPGHQQCIMVHDHSCHTVILSHSQLFTIKASNSLLVLLHRQLVTQHSHIVKNLYFHTVIMSHSQFLMQSVLSHSHFVEQLVYHSQFVTQSSCHTVILSHRLSHTYWQEITQSWLML